MGQISVPLPYDSNSVVFQGYYDATGHQFVAPQAGTVVNDSGNLSAPALIQVADGADIALGAKADSAWTSGSGSVVALLKAIAAAAISIQSSATSIATSSTAIQSSSAAIQTSTASIATSATAIATSAASIDTSSTTTASATANTSTNTGKLIPAGSNTALTTPPTNTNANSDTTLTFGATVNHWSLQNNSSINIHYNLDAAATSGTFLLAPANQVFWDWPVTAVHVLTVTAIPVNAANGLLLIGRV